VCEYVGAAIQHDVDVAQAPIEIADQGFHEEARLTLVELGDRGRHVGGPAVE